MATLNFFSLFLHLTGIQKNLFVCHPSLVQKLECRKKNQNEGKNKLYNHTKLAMYVFLCLYIFPPSLSK